MENKAQHNKEQMALDLLRQGDKEGLRVLYQLYSSVAYGVICKVVKMEDIAENVLQDVFLKVWKNFGQYDRSKGRFLSWMLQIARNAAIDKIRSKSYQQTLKSTNLETSVGNSAAYATSSNMENIDVRDKVKLLEDKHRELIELTYFEGYSQTEAAKKLNLPLGTVKGRVRKALKELRKVLSLFL